MHDMNRTDAMEEAILEALGEGAMLKELTMALSYDVKEEVYDWIARVYNIDVERDRASY